VVKDVFFSNSPRIMVIDDDATILELIKAVLVEDGFTVDARLNGRAALDSPPNEPPALVILDIYLPGLSGAELVQALRAKYGAGLPILVTSATNLDEEASTLGSYEYLAKPFDLDQLMAAVRRGLALPRCPL
jgi:DNA-binding response OmpR family regulator